MVSMAITVRYEKRCAAGLLIINRHKPNSICSEARNFYGCRRNTTSQVDVPLSSSVASTLSDLDYETVSEETLQSLADKFDELAELSAVGDDYDVNYASGVITVKLGRGRGTYVINKQTPNKQIWFSSPHSGPKRYDFVCGRWIYKHDGVCLHQLLTEELSIVLQDSSLDFETCQYGGKHMSD